VKPDRHVLFLGAAARRPGLGLSLGCPTLPTATVSDVASPVVAYSVIVQDSDQPVMRPSRDRTASADKTGGGSPEARAEVEEPAIRPVTERRAEDGSWVICNDLKVEQRIRDR